MLSTLLFLVAIAFAGSAIYIWQFRDQPNDEAPLPTPVNGNYGLANVIDSLRDAGLDANPGRTPPTADSDQIDQVGQNVTVGDTTVFIFLYSPGQDQTGIGAREAAMANVDASTMQLSSPSGVDIDGGETLTAYGGANVIAVVVGGDEETNQQVQDVIEGLT